MRLVAGSYERFLWGWKVDQKKGQLQSIFSYPAHLGPIKSIAVMGSVLATGGSDDIIKVFDLNAQRDMGTLMMHKGAVTTLEFYGTQTSTSSVIDYPKNLLSGSEDGTISIWDTDSWVHFKTMKGHKRGVNDLTIHPSGRLALSVGRDGHLNMYNLLKGRCTFTSKLPSEGSLISFGSSGESYSLARGEVVTINAAEDGRSLQTLLHSKRVLCMIQHENGLLFTGGEDCIVRAWDISSGKLAFSIPNAHSNRIRGVAVLAGQATESDDVPYLIASASSDGSVRVWDTRMVNKVENENTPSPVTEVQTKARLTCLVGSVSKKFAKKLTTSKEVSSKQENRKRASTHEETSSLKTLVSPSSTGETKGLTASEADQGILELMPSTGHEVEKINKSVKRKKSRKATRDVKV